MTPAATHRWLAIGLLTLGACGGDGGSDPVDAAPPGAQFTFGSRTRTFTVAQCSVVPVDTLYQLMCSYNDSTPATNIVLQAPQPIGAYDTTVPNLVIAVVDSATGAQFQCGTCTVEVTATAGPGQGSWRGRFELIAVSQTVTGTFDLPTRAP